MKRLKLAALLWTVMLLGILFLTGCSIKNRNPPIRNDWL